MAHTAIMKIALLVLAVLNPAYTSANTGGLDRGIDLYRTGDHDAALAELKAVIDESPRAPLAYYYAAKIRYEREQYSRAKGNLAAAIRDSAGFADAVGLLACAELKLGNTGDAVEHWKKFTAAVRGAASQGPVSAESIVLPEEFRAQAARNGKPAAKVARPSESPAVPAAGTASPEKTIHPPMMRLSMPGKYIEAKPVIEFVTRHHAQKPVEATLDRPWMRGLINALLGLVALFTLYALLKFGRTVEEEEMPTEPAGRRWTPVPAPPPEPERAYSVRRNRSGFSGEKKSHVKKPEKRPATVEALRDLRNRHAAEIKRLLKRL